MNSYPNCNLNIKTRFHHFLSEQVYPGRQIRSTVQHWKNVLLILQHMPLKRIINKSSVQIIIIDENSSKLKNMMFVLNLQN